MLLTIARALALSLSFFISFLTVTITRVHPILLLNEALLLFYHHNDIPDACNCTAMMHDAVEDAAAQLKEQLDLRPYGSDYSAGPLFLVMN